METGLISTTYHVLDSVLQSGDVLHDHSNVELALAQVADIPWFDIRGRVAILRHVLQSYVTTQVQRQSLLILQCGT